MIKANSDIVDIFTIDTDKREQYNGFHVHGKLVFDTRATFAADLLKHIVSAPGPRMPADIAVDYAIQIADNWFARCKEAGWSIETGGASEYITTPKQGTGFNVE